MVIIDSEHRAVGIDVLADGSYDGVILTTCERRSSLPRDLTERGIPHVLANRVLDVAESHSCSVDNVGGTAAIVGLVAGLGRRTVGAVLGPVTTSTGRERAEALRAGLRARGIRLRRDLVRRTSFLTVVGLDDIPMASWPIIDLTTVRCDLDALRGRPWPFHSCCAARTVRLPPDCGCRSCGRPCRRRAVYRNP
ncbi:hypothetical protein ACWD25_56065 [Streptomyces sp. NPDC002920]